MIEAMRPSGGAPHAKAFCDMDGCNREEVVACAYHRHGSRTAQAQPDEAQIHSKLGKQGWSYIKGKLRCPSCEAKRKVVPMKSVEKKSAPQKAEVPEPTKRERIQIISMLAEVYDLDAGMYTGGDTDETVAEVLGVRVGFVEAIRSAEFGPAGGNEDIARLRSEVDEFLKEATAELKARTEKNEMLIKAMERAKGYRERLERVEKAVGPRVLRRA